MKLIDFLVQELPKFGGWPEESKFIEQAGDGTLFDAEDLVKPYFFGEHPFSLAEDWQSAVISREKYEEAVYVAGTKRDSAIKAMMCSSAVLLEVTAGLNYDAIAAGEIPHITLN